MPLADHPVGDFIGYRVRTGERDVAAHDWQQYLSFADRHLRYHRGKCSERSSSRC